MANISIRMEDKLKQQAEVPPRGFHISQISKNKNLTPKSSMLFQKHGLSGQFPVEILLCR